MTAQYANVRRANVERLLKWLLTKHGIQIRVGSKHVIIVKYMFWDRPFPIPFKNGAANKFIIQAFMSQLIGSGICTKEEFDEQIK